MYIIYKFHINNIIAKIFCIFLIFYYAFLLCNFSLETFPHLNSISFEHFFFASYTEHIIHYYCQAYSNNNN